MAPNLVGSEVVGMLYVRSGMLGLSGSRLPRAVLALSDGRVLDVILNASLRGLGTKTRFIALWRTSCGYGYRSSGAQFRFRMMMILEALPSTVSPVRFSRDNLAAALRTLADLHAQFWERPLAQFDWLRNMAAIDGAS